MAIYIYFESQLCICMLDWFCHTLDYSKSGLAFLWKRAPLVTKSTVCFVRLIYLVFICCPLELTGLHGFFLLLFFNLLFMFNLLSALLNIQLPVKHWPLVYIVLCFNCVYLKSWPKMLINCDTLWEKSSLIC